MKKLTMIMLLLAFGAFTIAPVAGCGGKDAKKEEKKEEKKADDMKKDDMKADDTKADSTS